MIDSDVVDYYYEFDNFVTKKNTRSAGSFGFVYDTNEILLSWKEGFHSSDSQ